MVTQRDVLTIMDFTAIMSCYINIDLAILHIMIAHSSEDSHTQPEIIIIAFPFIIVKEASVRRMHFILIFPLKHRAQ